MKKGNYKSYQAALEWLSMAKINLSMSLMLPPRLQRLIFDMMESLDVFLCGSYPQHNSVNGSIRQDCD